MTQFTNQTFDQISLGETVTVAHTVTRDEVELLALVSGDANPFADCDALADGTEPLPRCDGVSAEALVHGVLKRRLPGPGTVIVAHALTYAGQAHVGDELMATVTVTDKQAPDRVVLACQVRRGEDVLVETVHIDRRLAVENSSPDYARMQEINPPCCAPLPSAAVVR